MTPEEQRVWEEVERRRDELVTLLCDLVAFDTRAPDGPNGSREEAKLQAFVAERLRASGFAVRVWEPEAADLPPSRYPIPPGHDFRGRPQLLATAQGTGGGRTLLFNGHIDVVTVEPEHEWTTPPFSPDVRGGRVYGRGACDMKGGVASMVLAAEVLRALEVPLQGDLLVCTTTDEESTAAGALAVAAALQADGGIVTEPTRLEPWLGTRGSLLPTITIEGSAGHAGIPPEHWTAGGPVNAIEKMQLVLDALRHLREDWLLRPECAHEYLMPGSIVPTAMRAGEWMVSVPARCELECHVQYLPGQVDAEGYGSAVERELEARVRAACDADPWLAAHPPSISWSGDVPPSWVEPDDPIAATALDVLEESGLPRAINRRTAWYDGATFTRAGIPSIALGPGDVQRAHTVDEYVPVDELVRCAQVLAVTAMRFCGT